MNIHDRKNIIKFIVNTGLFIHEIDKENICSFVYGYEYASNFNCDFTLIIRKTMESKYNIKYDSDGWPGQIEYFAKMNKIAWVRAFKNIGLEVIAGQEVKLENDLEDVIKSRIKTLINRFNLPKEELSFDNFSKEEWLGLSLINYEWYKNIWDKEEWVIVKSIDDKLR